MRHVEHVLSCSLIIFTLCSILFVFIFLQERELHNLDFGHNGELGLFFNTAKFSLKLCHRHFLVHFTKRVHYGCQDQIHQEKGAEYDNQEEVDWSRDFLPRVHHIVHVKNPSLKREALEDCWQRDRQVVERLHSIEDSRVPVFVCNLFSVNPWIKAYSTVATLITYTIWRAKSWLILIYDPVESFIQN